MVSRTETQAIASVGADPGPLGYAPVALFVYRRTDLLDRVLSSIEACPEFEQTRLYIFSDGPRDEAGAADVAKVRALLNARLKPNITLVESPANKGLARSIAEGVSQLCDTFGRVIVLEDDLLVSPALLTWFNAALLRYEADERVMQISGHMFDAPRLAGLDRGIFLPMTTSWGWATWKRAWARFDPTAKGWQEGLADRKIRRKFDLDGRYPYSRMLERQMAGEIDSWAIRWYWSVFQAGGVALFPPQSFVANLGTDGAATHRGMGGFIRSLWPSKAVTLRQESAQMAEVIEVDEAIYRAVKTKIWQSTSKLSLSYWLNR